MLRRLIKSVIPKPIWKKLGVWRRQWLARHNHRISTQEVFSRIYQKGVWGNQEGFDSGSGSEDQAVDPYVESIRAWAAQHQASELTAVDLGCGDFRVGRRIHPLFQAYHAIDIVPELIQHHRSRYQDPHLTFHCLNAIEDSLPAGEVLFVRQVLQHLSNAQILKILPKIQEFQHVIVTEHLPHPSMAGSLNLDKVQGGDIRLSQNSGVDLEAPPFQLKALETHHLLEVPGGEREREDGVIRTTYYRMSSLRQRDSDEKK